MPQKESAKKALRVSERRRTINDRWRRLFRDEVKSVRRAVAAKDAAQATAAYTKAQQALDKAAQHKVIHRNVAARLKARLQRAIHAL